MELTIVIPESELFDSEKNEFIYTKEQKLVLKHSLLSVSKWEAIWKKPYLEGEKTWDESISYIQCMTINKNVDPVVYQNIDKQTINEIHAYIDDTMTASRIPDIKKGSGIRGVITSETIYFWMVNFNIPFECEKWHLNRLLALLKDCSYRSQSKESGQKISEHEKNVSWAKINQMRRKALKSKG